MNGVNERDYFVHQQGIRAMVTTHHHIMVLGRNCMSEGLELVPVEDFEEGIARRMKFAEQCLDRGEQGDAKEAATIVTKMLLLRKNVILRTMR